MRLGYAGFRRVAPYLQFVMFMNPLPLPPLLADVFDRVRLQLPDGIVNWLLAILAARPPALWRFGETVGLWCYRAAR